MPLSEDILNLHIGEKGLGKTHRFSHQTMATVFEIYIMTEDADYARQAASEAWRVVDRLEQDLSRFIENSDISRINSQPAHQPILIGLDAFECLKQCADLFQKTNSAFDVTIGRIIDFWKNRDNCPFNPSSEMTDIQKHRSGMHLLRLDETNHTAERLSESILLDLGGFGKGYAVDRIASLLREWEIESALIHAGRSTVVTLGTLPDDAGWPVTLNHPFSQRNTLAHISLKNQAISGSGLKKGRHIIDPRIQKPVEIRLAVWASTPDGASSDALSTAFMVMTPEEIETYCSEFPDTKAFIIDRKMDGNSHILKFGNWESTT